MKKYEKLKKQYPEYISLDQLYGICRIAKRSARYLVEHGIIPAVDTGRKTWRYKIAIDDVITYLHRREQLGTMIPPGASSSRSMQLRRPRLSFVEVITPGSTDEVLRYFEHICENYNDVLTVLEIVEITGLNKKTILLFLKEGAIKSLASSPRYIIPKTYLLEFIVTPQYVKARSNSDTFKKIIEDFENWKKQHN